MQHNAIRKEYRSWEKEDGEKAKTFARHLSRIFEPHDIPTPQDELKIIEDFLNSPSDASLTIKHYTIAEIAKEIKLLNSKKASGYDLITAKLLQELPGKALAAITHIYNAVTRLHYFSIQWKFVEIILILKPGKPPQETTYRPISLLLVLSKLLERVILKRLQPLISDGNVIPKHQFRFRKRDSAQ